jgi:transposase
MYICMMAQILQIEVKESIQELRVALKKSSSRIRPRIQMLLEIKKSLIPLSKYELSEKVCANHNSITSWRKIYRTGGFDLLSKHNQGGKRKIVIDTKTHNAIQKRITSSTEGFRSYKDLQEWVDANYISGIKYITLLKYVQDKFGAKLKSTRKSHIKKDVEAVEAFKKNPSRNKKTH